MKKNSTMRVAALLLALTLMTSCFVGGTFAKYTTAGTATDTARVAKWGVVVNGEGKEAFAIQYDDVAGDAGTKVVSTEKVVAPGTKGALANFTITGQPEVEVSVSYDAELNIDNWVIASGEYCPIIVTVNGVNFYIGKVVGGNTIDTIDKLEEAVEAAIEICATTYAAGTDLAAEVVDDVNVSWTWMYEGTDHPIADYQTDGKDTELGNWSSKGKAQPNISIAIKCTITQVD